MAEYFPDDDKLLAGDEGMQGDDAYADKQAISARIDRMLSIDRFQRSLFEREWFRNVLFLAGQQWIIYERGRWRPRALPAWFPRAQTNKFMEKHNDIMSQLVQGKPIPITYLPATDDPADIATAEVGQRLREVIYSEANIEEKEEEVAAWLIATGNAFVIPYYDMDEEHGTTFMPHQRCLTCGGISDPAEIAENGGVCPICAENGVMSSSFEDAIDPTGAPIGGEVPVGAIQADVASPFEIRLDHRIVNMRDQRRFVRQRRYDLDFAKEQWPEFKDQITSDYGNDLSQYYLDVLAHVTSSFSASGGFIGGGPASPKNPKVTAYEFYELPSEKFPQGLKAVRLGANAATVVEAGPLTSKYGAGTKQGKLFLPLVHFGFDRIPGRFWRKTRLDDLVPLQIFRNTVEANLRLTTQRMGNGIWLKPKGSGVSVITGEPGQEIEYNPVSLGGTSFAKPERVPAELTNLQPLIMLMSKIDDSMERVAGTFFLQGGDTPPGVTAASALAYLGERAQKSMSPLMTSWAKGWKTFEMFALELARDNWDDERIRVIAGKNRKWDTAKFTKADLQGSVNMLIDYNGLFPKSNATERAQIAQLAQLGIVNPQDPEQNFKILEKFGATDLKMSIDLDVKDATREQDLFLSEGKQPVLRPFVDNSTVHLLYHTDFAKTDEFMELPPDQQQVWYDHIKSHITDIVTRRMMFTQAGLDPDAPGTEEITGGQAAAAAQSAGIPSGAEGPDARLDASGNPLPAPPPDIAAGGLPQGPDGTQVPADLQAKLASKAQASGSALPGA